MEEYYPYHCMKCGNCCRHVNGFKSLDRGDGICIYLTKDNICSIYNHRPNVCNGKYIYEKFFSNMSVKEFHELASIICQELKFETEE